MKWLLAGLSFALAVTLAIGSVAIRAENTRLRHRLELQRQQIEDRMLELRRLSVQALEDARPDRLAQALRDAMTRHRRRAAREVQSWQ